MLNFDEISVCKVDSWNESRLKGKFIRVKEEADKKKDAVLSKFYYTLNLSKDTKTVISVH